jgi:hypothetical protein
VLVGNKSDLPDDQREVSLAIGKDQAAAFGCPFFESSAKVPLSLSLSLSASRPQLAAARDHARDPVQRR